MSNPEKAILLIETIDDRVYTFYADNTYERIDVKGINKIVSLWRISGGTMEYQHVGEPWSMWGGKTKHDELYEKLSGLIVLHTIMEN